MRYDLLTKLLHWGIALVVVMQMLTSLVMEEPEHGEVRSAVESGAFEIHEYIGLVAFALLLARWLWGFSGHAIGGWQHLFPWLFADGRKELIDDIKREVPGWLKGEIPEPGERDAIAKTVHGAGLMIASLMAATGLVLFFAMDEGGEITGLAHGIKEVHEFFSTLMWIFLVGHAAAAIAHQWVGHDVLGKMFLLRSPK